MAIKPPPLKSNPSVLCDWVELKTIADPSGTFRINSLKRIWDTHRENENSDPEGLQKREEYTEEFGVSGKDDDIFLDSIFDELEERINALSDSYPFRFNSSGTKFSLKESWGEGEAIYLFCLILSNSKRGDILDGTWLPCIDATTRDLFQACSTLAAAGEVRGSAISFGWPRPDNNPPFLKRLKEVYALFGEGEVVSSPRPGVSPNPKDEEIDVIAWKPRLDKSAGTDYLLGQVASGENWEAKSIKGGATISFHHNWFYQAPPSDPKSSIFIPHLIQVVYGGQGNRRDRMNAITAKYGIVVDRLRLPELAAKGIGIADGIERLGISVVIERRDDIPKIRQWVTLEVSKLRTALAEQT